MAEAATRKARDLEPSVRAYLVDMLDHELRDDDEVTVSVRPHVHVPTAEQRAAAAARLKVSLDSIGEKLKHIPDAEIDEAIDQAMRAARPTCQRSS